MFLIITINFLIHLLFLTIFFSIIDRCQYTLLNGEGGIVKLRIAFLFDKCVIILTICTKINLSTYIIKFTNILLFYYPIRLLLSHYHPTLNYLILPLELFFLILPIMMLKIGSFLIKIFIFVFGNDPRQPSDLIEIAFALSIELFMIVSEGLLYRQDKLILFEEELLLLIGFLLVAIEIAVILLQFFTWLL